MQQASFLYSIHPNFSGGQACANKVDSDQTPQMSFIHQFCFKVLNKYGRGESIRIFRIDKVCGDGIG